MENTIQQVILELERIRDGINQTLSPPTQPAGSKLETFGAEAWSRLGRCVEALRKIEAA